MSMWFLVHSPFGAIAMMAESGREGGREMISVQAIVGTRGSGMLYLSL